MLLFLKQLAKRLPFQEQEISRSVTDGTFNLSVEKDGPWSEWGPCTAPCGPGLRARQRECNSLEYYCTGSGIQHEYGECHLADCHADGKIIFSLKFK